MKTINRVPKPLEAEFSVAKLSQFAIANTLSNDFLIHIRPFFSGFDCHLSCVNKHLEILEMISRCCIAFVANNKCADQAEQMCKLICTFV